MLFFQSAESIEIFRAVDSSGLRSIRTLMPLAAMRVCLCVSLSLRVCLFVRVYVLIYVFVSTCLCVNLYSHTADKSTS